MKILVMGGMHDNETLGIEIVKLFQKSPVANIDVMLLNEQVIEADERYIKQDLNRSFPGDAASDDYETRRAAEVLAACSVSYTERR